MHGPFLGGVVGLLGAVGLLLIVASWTRPTAAPVRRRARKGALDRLIQEAGVTRATRATIVVACAGVAVTAGLIALLITAVPVVAMLACIAGAVIPLLLLRRRAATRQALVRASWPDAIDVLVSGIRAGLSLGQALADLGRIGPDPLKGVFREFETDLRATSFRTALTNLQERCADPVADRVAAALLIAHESGGSDLVSLMRSLATMLREDARTRGEIRARQSWTINGARLAVIAPWATLALLCTRPEAVAAYSTPEGALVILVAAVASALAYALMLRMARLPREPRWTA